jgi:hypothetical protein
MQRFILKNLKDIKMKITLEFESMEDAKPYINGLDYFSALWDFQQFLRAQLKHGELTEAKWTVYEEIQQRFFSILEENNVNLN